MAARQPARAGWALAPGAGMLPAMRALHLLWWITVAGLGPAPAQAAPPASPLATAAQRAAQARAAAAAGDWVGATDALAESLHLDPQQPALRRRQRTLDPDRALPGPDWVAVSRLADAPPPLDPAAPAEGLWVHRHLHVRGDGRSTEAQQALWIARDPTRAAGIAVPPAADVHRLRRWPQAGGPPVELTPAEAAQGWATAVGDQLEAAWVVDHPAQAADGAVLRVRAAVPIHGGSLRVTLPPAGGWWAAAPGLTPAAAGAGALRWTVAPQPARTPGHADTADWLTHEPALAVGRWADGVAFAQAMGHRSPVQAPRAVLAAARWRTLPLAARLQRVRDGFSTPAAQAAALRVLGVEAWPVRTRPRWARPAGTDWPLSEALLPVTALWLPSEGVVWTGAQGPGELAGASAVVLDGSGRWVELPAPTQARQREGQVDSRGDGVFLVRWPGDDGSAREAWAGAALDGDTWQADRRRWWAPAPALAWQRWHGWAARSAPAWLGAPRHDFDQWLSDEAPPTVRLRGPAGARYARTVARLGEGYRVARHLHWPGGLLPLSAREGFLQFCAAVERAEAAR